MATARASVGNYFIGSSFFSARSTFIGVGFAGYNKVVSVFGGSFIGPSPHLHAQTASPKDGIYLTVIDAERLFEVPRNVNCRIICTFPRERPLLALNVGS